MSFYNTFFKHMGIILKTKITLIILKGNLVLRLKLEPKVAKEDKAANVVTTDHLFSKKTARLTQMTGLLSMLLLTM